MKILNHIILSISILMLSTNLNYAQGTGKIIGQIIGQDGPIEGASIHLEKVNQNVQSDKDGNFVINSLPTGMYFIQVKAVGKQNYRSEIGINSGKDTEILIHLKEDLLQMNEVVVSATRYGVDRKQAPVIVNVLSPKLFNATQSIAMSETLNFQPGVRVETNCQNCGFSQVRLNGLEGAYSQILINSRSVFSALNSVYGLDQIPTSMVDRIEVVRSGGSALFGSNAIAGTINIITKDPVENTWQIANTNNLIDGKARDHALDFNASVVADDLMNGVTFYGMNRNRQAYDVNGDGFSEITKLQNTTFGSKAFFRPDEQQKITLDLSIINEFRRGGDQLDRAPHFTDITEQLDHKTWIGGLSYDWFSKDYSDKFSVYISTQETKRESYYGGLAGERTLADTLMASNSYGHTKDFAMVTGAQYTKLFEKDVFTAGLEFQKNQTKDEMSGYNRLVDQKTNNTGLYAQYEWKPIENLTTLLGARFDHIRVDGRYTLQALDRRTNQNNSVFSPRMTLLYNFHPKIQFRGGFARGFRAPQAFNEDMHVTSAGGQQVFVLITDSLDTEYSNAYTASLNYTDQWGRLQTSLLVETFYTQLLNPFTTVRTKKLEEVILDEMRNGSGAVVKGINFEWNMSPSTKYSLQAGGTWQSSTYKKPQTIIEADLATGHQAIQVNKFVRSPQVYGYLNNNWKVTERLAFDITGVYTGRMTVPHQVKRELVKSPDFMELNLRLGYTWEIYHHLTIEWNAGVQNIMNAYQKDFDSGPKRDSDYVYGPSRPRTFYVGLKIGHFH